MFENILKFHIVFNKLIPVNFFFLEEPNIRKKINGYIDRETSGPDQKLFSLSDTLSSQPILVSSRKKNLQGLAT